MNREQFEKDRETYQQGLLAAKQAEALALYVRRLKEQAKDEVRIDSSYLNDGNDKDGGVPSQSDFEEEGE